MTRPATSGRTRRNEVRSTVLEATARLLETGESYTTLGITRICREAGVSRSAFYTSFENKTELLIALTVEASNELFAASEHWITPAAGIDVHQLQQTIRGSLAVMRANPAILNACSEVAAYDPDLARFWADRMDRAARALSDVIADARAEGTVRAQVDPALAANFIVWGGERLMSRHVATSEPASDEDAARNLANAISAMLFVE